MHGPTNIKKASEFTKRGKSLQNVREKRLRWLPPSLQTTHISA